MENHHFSWDNSLFLWPFSIAFCRFTRPGIWFLGSAGCHVVEDPHVFQAVASQWTSMRGYSWCVDTRPVWRWLVGVAWGMPTPASGLENVGIFQPCLMTGGYLVFPTIMAWSPLTLAYKSWNHQPDGYIKQQSWKILANDQNGIFPNRGKQIKQVICIGSQLSHHLVPFESIKLMGRRGHRWTMVTDYCEMFKNTIRQDTKRCVCHPSSNTFWGVPTNCILQSSQTKVCLC